MNDDMCIAQKIIDMYMYNIEHIYTHHKIYTELLDEKEQIIEKCIEYSAKRIRLSEINKMIEEYNTKLEIYREEDTQIEQKTIEFYQILMQSFYDWWKNKEANPITENELNITSKIWFEMTDPDNPNLQDTTVNKYSNRTTMCYDTYAKANENNRNTNPENIDLYQNEGSITSHNIIEPVNDKKFISLISTHMKLTDRLEEIKKGNNIESKNQIITNISNLIVTYDNYIKDIYNLFGEEDNIRPLSLEYLITLASAQVSIYE